MIPASVVPDAERTLPAAQFYLGTGPGERGVYARVDIGGGVVLGQVGGRVMRTAPDRFDPNVYVLPVPRAGVVLQQRGAHRLATAPDIRYFLDASAEYDDRRHPPADLGEGLVISSAEQRASWHRYLNGAGGLHGGTANVALIVYDHAPGRPIDAAFGGGSVLPGRVYAVTLRPILGGEQLLTRRAPWYFAPNPAQLRVIDDTDVQNGTFVARAMRRVLGLPPVPSPQEETALLLLPPPFGTMLAGPGFVKRLLYDQGHDDVVAFAVLLVGSGRDLVGIRVAPDLANDAELRRTVIEDAADAVRGPAAPALQVMAANQANVFGASRDLAKRLGFVRRDMLFQRPPRPLAWRSPDAASPPELVALAAQHHLQAWVARETRAGPAPIPGAGPAVAPAVLTPRPVVAGALENPGTRTLELLEVVPDQFHHNPKRMVRAYHELLFAWAGLGHRGLPVRVHAWPDPARSAPLTAVLAMLGYRPAGGPPNQVGLVPWTQMGAS